MLRQKEKCFHPRTVSLEELVPVDRFCCALESSLDLHFIYDAVKDAKYGTIPNIVGLEKEWIRAYLPMTDFSGRSGFYPAEHFHHDTERALYICPQGQALTRYSQRQREEVVHYHAKSKVCNRCPVKAECTSSRRGEMCVNLCEILNTSQCHANLRRGTFFFFRTRRFGSCGR